MTALSWDTMEADARAQVQAVCRAHAFDLAYAVKGHTGTIPQWVWVSCQPVEHDGHVLASLTSAGWSTTRPRQEDYPEDGSEVFAAFWTGFMALFERDE